MSVKNTTAVHEYTESLIRLRNALANLTEFVEGLPSPDERGILPTLHYGHVGTVKHIENLISEAMLAADGFGE